MKHVAVGKRFADRIYVLSKMVSTKDISVAENKRT